MTSQPDRFSTENPFLRSGLQPSVIGAVLEAGGPDAVRTLLKGVGRVVARSLHPDMQPSAAVSGELDALTQAHTAILGKDDDAVGILASAYAVRRRSRSTARSRKNKEPSATETVTREYIRTGSLVISLADMFIDEAIHTPGVEDKRLLIASLYGGEKQLGRSNWGNYYEVSPAIEGIAYKKLRPTKITQLRGKGLSNTEQARQRNEHLDAISADFCGKVAEVIAAEPYEHSALQALFTTADTVRETNDNPQKDRVVVWNQRGEYGFYKSGEHIGTVSRLDLMESPLLEDGWFIFNDNERKASKGVGPRFTISNIAYLSDGAEGEVEDYARIIGTANKEFANQELDRQGIAVGMDKRLPTSAASRSDLPVYDIPITSLARLEGSYRPTVNAEDYLLVASSQKTIQLLGKILFSTRY